MARRAAMGRRRKKAAAKAAKKTKRGKRKLESDAGSRSSASRVGDCVIRAGVRLGVISALAVAPRRPGSDDNRGRRRDKKSRRRPQPFMLSRALQPAQYFAAAIWKRT